MTISIAKQILSTLAVFLLLPLSVDAASLYFSPETATLAPDEQVYIDIMVNTQGKDINALEFTVSFKADDIEILEVRDGRSVIDFWITRGYYNNILEVAGIITGGIGSGGNGPYKIATLVLKGKGESEGITWIRNQRVLANDGLGTTLVSSGDSFSYIIKNGSLPSEGDDSSRIDEALDDTEPPLNFEIILSRDSNMFDGQYFIVFSTQDSGSGVAYYEVKEGEGEWVRTESPHLLTDQRFGGLVLVKAVDNAGNERVVSLQPSAFPEDEEKEEGGSLQLSFVIIGGLLMASLFLAVIKKRGGKRFEDPAVFF